MNFKITFNGFDVFAKDQASAIAGAMGLAMAYDDVRVYQLSDNRIIYTSKGQ